MRLRVLRRILSASVLVSGVGCSDEVSASADVIAPAAQPGGFRLTPDNVILRIGDPKKNTTLAGVNRVYDRVGR